MRRQQTIAKLADALTFYREHKPQNPHQQRRVIELAAIRFGFSTKLMIEAIHIMSGVDVTESRRRSR